MANRYVVDNTLGDQEFTFGEGADTTIQGTSNKETVNILDGVNVTANLAGGNDRVNMTNNLSEYTITQEGFTGLKLEDSNGNVTTLNVAGDSADKKVAFGDGSATVTNDGGTISIGGESIGSGSTADLSNVSLDSDDPSPIADGGGGGGGDAQTFTLTGSASEIDEGESVPFTVATDDGSTVSEDTDVAYTLSGIQAADIEANSLTGTVTIASGSSEATFTVNTVTDALDETETMTADLDDYEASDAVVINDVPEGETFNLTTSVDVLGPSESGDSQTTSGNDYFVGLVSGASTLNAADQLDGGGGTDTLGVTFNDSSTALPVADIQNLEVFKLNAVGSGNIVEDANRFPGLEEIWSDRSSHDLTISNLADGAKAGIIGDGVTAIGATTALTFGYASGVTSGTLAVDGGVTGAGYENIALNNDTGKLSTLTIESTGDSNTLKSIDLDADTGGATVSTINVNATTDLTIGNITNVVADTAITVSGSATTVGLGTLSTNVASVNASGLTSGGVDLTVGDGGVEITGGGGDDTVSFADLAQTESVDLGFGTGDTVVFTADTNYVSSALNVSNAEVLRAGTAGDTYDVSFISGLTSIEATNASGELTFNSLGASTPVTALDNITTLTLNLLDPSGSTDSVSVTIDDDAAAAGVITLGAIKAPNVETLDLTTADSLASETSHVVSALTGSTKLETINVSGNSDLTITDATVPTPDLTIDAQGFSNALTVGADGTSGINSGSTVKGGSGADTLYLDYGNLSNSTGFEGGDGDDTLYVDGDGSDVADGDFAAITGVENLTIDSTTATTITLGGYAEQAIQTLSGNLDITAKTLDDNDATIDASAMSNAGVDIEAKLLADATSGNITLTAKGGSKADTLDITLDDGGNSDSVNANITSGDGIDIINYTLAQADSDDDVATFFTKATDASDAEIITGFVGGDDQTLYDYNGTVQGTVGTDVTSASGLNTAFGNQAGHSVYVDTTNVVNNDSSMQGTEFMKLLYSDASNLESNWSNLETELLDTGGALNGTFSSLDAAIGNSQSALIVLDNDTGSAIMRLTNDTTTANTIEAAELELVGVLTDTTGLDAADFA